MHMAWKLGDFSLVTDIVNVLDKLWSSILMEVPQIKLQRP